MPGVLVCTACGSVACWDGDLMCENALRADANLCSCEWGTVDLQSPLIVHPDCPTHGEPS